MSSIIHTGPPPPPPPPPEQYWTTTPVVRTIEMGGCTYNASNDLEAGLKDVPVQRFSRWQQAARLFTFLKACHRFQYTLVLKREQEVKKQTARKVRAHIQAIRAAYVLKQGSADQVKGTGDHFPIEPDSLTRTNTGVEVLQQYGGARLRTCIWEELPDFTRIVLVIAFVGSVVMGILEETEKLGWHDIFSVAIVSAIFILVTVGSAAISDYTQDRQFQHLIKEIKKNKQLQVTAVGKFTESGNLMPSTNSKDAEKKTPLQVLLKEVATFMGAVGFLVAVVVAYVVWLRDHFTGDNLNGSHPIPGDTLEEVIKISLIAVTIFVVAVPEVLPLSYNLILLISMKKINADKAFVLRPAAWETMAFCNILLCDKTAIATSEGACKQGIKEEMKLYQGAGIKVCMFTNENLQTARAIAKECHILGSEASDVSEENLIEGQDFRELSDSERETKADKILVMAESSPEDVLYLVQALRKIGKVVAVIGYGPDHAPALHEADIGIAMGGTADSDIIILDDNFATVTKGFRWGGSVREKVLKVMQQQLTANVVAVTINCMAAVYYRHIPLNAVQFVWVNLIIFGLGPLALATEPPADHLMSRPPIDRGQPRIKYIPWMRLLIKVGYQIIALLFINFQAGSLLKIYTSHDHATKVKNTMIFNTFVVCQISIEFGARKTGMMDSPRNWVTSNSVFLGIVGIILAIQFIIIEFLGKEFFIVRLNWNEWQFSLTLGIVELLFAMLLFVKHLAQRNHH